MNLNYIAFLLISFIPLFLGWLWFGKPTMISRMTKYSKSNTKSLTIKNILWLFLMSVLLVYGFCNLIIHQMGFYELFFTDIMMGSAEAQVIVDEFLQKYGDKHRHFGHGIFHGVINAFVIMLPLISMITLLDRKGKAYFLHHFSYWLVSCALVGGLISEFV